MPDIVYCCTSHAPDQEEIDQYLASKGTYLFQIFTSVGKSSDDSEASSSSSSSSSSSTSLASSSSSSSSSAVPAEVLDDMDSMELHAPADPPADVAGGDEGAAVPQEGGEQTGSEGPVQQSD